MANYSTPDVYVEEISTLPPSVAEVSTAVPAFIGYTEFAEKNGVDLTNVPLRISTFLEYKTYFGGPDRVKFTITADSKNNFQSPESVLSDQQHKLYYSIDHFFKNGGSDCYIISIGAFGPKKAADFEAGLDALAKEDEPTLIVLSEAASLAAALTADDYYSLCQAALLQCSKLADRFCIFDVLSGDGQVQKFRDNIGTNNLKYGAAYYPFLNTSITYIYQDEDIVVNQTPADLGEYLTNANGLRITYRGVLADKPKIIIVAEGDKVGFAVDEAGTTLTLSGIGTGKSTGEIVTAFKTGNLKPSKFYIEKSGDGTADVTAVIDKPGAPLVASSEAITSTLDEIKKSQTGFYNLVKQEMNKARVVLPPGPAVAGIYAMVDRERGVWKAPANVSLNSVISPAVKITANDQDKLNIDENGGKSVNAIRSFVGKGTLIWGARTLAGNDNEWRYISVRRLFIMIEESAKKASYFAVFEPNDATTWLKVRGMIESFLYGLWQQGALAGSTPKAAYYVNVGLGTTMTQQDILEGRMIIEIGIAAVRPAEFIVLSFSHKLQEA